MYNIISLIALCTQLAHAIIAHMWGSLGTRLLHTESRGLTRSFMAGGKVGGNTGGAGTAVQDVWQSLSWLGGE